MVFFLNWVAGFQFFESSVKCAAADPEAFCGLGPVAPALFQSAQNKGLFRLVQI
jgi:hypothetical protein